MYNDENLKEHLEAHPHFEHASKGIVDAFTPADWWFKKGAPSLNGEYLTTGLRQTLRDGTEWYNVHAPKLIDTKDGSISLFFEPPLNSTLCLLGGKSDEARMQTARACHELLQASGLRHPQASFSMVCATYFFLAGNEGMEKMALQLSEAIGWIPSLVIIGGPEFGNTDRGPVTGGYSTSSIIFGTEKDSTASSAILHLT